MGFKKRPFHFSHALLCSMRGHMAATAPAPLSASGESGPQPAAHQQQRASGWFQGQIIRGPASTGQPPGRAVDELASWSGVRSRIQSGVGAPRGRLGSRA